MVTREVIVRRQIAVVLVIVRPVLVRSKATSASTSIVASSTTATVPFGLASIGLPPIVAVMGRIVVRRWRVSVALWKRGNKQTIIRLLKF